MKYRLLLLTSYCGGEAGCTDDFPCAECMDLCNVFETEDVATLGLMQNIGGLDYNRRQSTLSLPKENAK